MEASSSSEDELMKDHESPAAEDEEDEGRTPFFIRRPGLFNAILVSIYVGVGILTLTFVNKLSWVTSWYVVVQIITTIGYGDIATNNVHVFMTIYVFLGTVLVANMFNDYVNSVIENSESALRERLRALEHQVLNEQSSMQEIRQRYGKMNALTAALLLYFLFIVVWALFFYWYESCTCSYGVTEIENCTMATCHKVGNQLSFMDAVYMAVITFSTVGFGDFSPKSHGGRIIGSILMIFGVLSFVNLVGKLAERIDIYKRASEKNIRVERKHFDEIDSHGTGSIDLTEFKEYFLIQQGKTTVEELQRIERIFHSLDKNEDGKLSWDEIKSKVLDIVND